METSINLDLDDLIGPEDDFDDDDNLPPMTRLPGLDENDEDQENLLNTSGQRNEGLLDTLLDPAGGEGGAAPAAKRVVNRKPIPKLDATRLTGERGLPILVKHFEKVKFKGKGHEASDLDRLMRVMEHWAHRLFPKMPFDDVIERIEKLGHKKPVQTCIKRIRLDMPLLDEDFISRGGEDAIEGGGENAEASGGLGDDFPTPTFPGSQQPSSSMPKVPMTDEQKERIERNKRLAMERRLKKQKEASSSQPLPAASQSGGLNEEELNDLFGTGPAKTKPTFEEDDGIDSDEAEMEREMWASQMEGRKEEKRASQQGPAPAPAPAQARDEMEIDLDEEEMENELWNQMTQPVETQSKVSGSHQSTSQTKKSRIEDESDDEDVGKSSKVGSLADSHKGTKRSKRMIDDDSDDDVMEEVKSSQMDLSQEMLFKATKKRRVIDDDDDEDEEMQDTNKMTVLLSPKPPSDSPMITSTSGLKKGSQKNRILDDNDDEEEEDGVRGIKDHCSKKDTQLPESEIDICNQMMEPVPPPNPTEFRIMETLPSQDSLDMGALDGAGETGSEMWNQMTEKVSAQNNDSEDESYTALKARTGISDQVEGNADETQIIEGETQIDDDQTQIDDDQTQIDDDQTQMDDDQTQIDEDQTQIDEDQTQIDEDQTQIDDDQSQLDEDQTQIDEDQTQIDEDETQIDIDICNQDTEPVLQANSEDTA